MALPNGSAGATLLLATIVLASLTGLIAFPIPAPLFAAAYLAFS